MPKLREVAERGGLSTASGVREFSLRHSRPLRRADRRQRLALPVAACDVYTWTLLRRRLGLRQRQTELALAELPNPLVEGS